MVGAIAYVAAESLEFTAGIYGRLLEFTTGIWWAQ
jgi:hypothetical protein